MRSSVSRMDLILVDVATEGSMSSPMLVAPDAAIPSPRELPFDLTLNFLVEDLLIGLMGGKPLGKNNGNNMYGMCICMCGCYAYFLRARPIPAALSALPGFPLRDVPWLLGILRGC